MQQQQQVLSGSLPRLQLPPRAPSRPHLQPRLLQRHQLAGVLVARLVHLAVGTLPDLLYFLIVLLRGRS